VVAACVVLLTGNIITSSCVQSCALLPLHKAAESGGVCETVYIDRSISGRGLHSSTFQLNVSTLSHVMGCSACFGEQTRLRLSKDVDECKPLIGGVPAAPIWTDLNLGHRGESERPGVLLTIDEFNGTFSKDFDFENFGCNLPKSPESLTRGGWGLQTFGSTGYPYSNNKWEASGFGTVGTKTEFAEPDSTTSSCAGVATTTTSFELTSTQIGSYLYGPTEQCSPTTKKWCSSPSK